MLPDAARQTAYHEAGHMIAAAASGLAVWSACLKPFESFVEHPHSHNADTEAMIAAAGFVAERLAGFDPDVEEEEEVWDKDRRQVEESGLTWTEAVEMAESVLVSRVALLDQIVEAWERCEPDEDGAMWLDEATLAGLAEGLAKEAAS